MLLIYWWWKDEILRKIVWKRGIREREILCCNSAMLSIERVDSPKLHDRSRADPWSAFSQWETSLQSNAVSHWLGANLESTLRFKARDDTFKMTGSTYIFLSKSCLHCRSLCATKPPIDRFHQTQGSWCGPWCFDERQAVRFILYAWIYCFYSVAYNWGRCNFTLVFGLGVY